MKIRYMKFVLFLIAGLLSSNSAFGQRIRVIGQWDMNSTVPNGTTNLVPDINGGSGLRLVASSPFGAPTLSADGGGASGLTGDKALVFDDANHDRALSDTTIWSGSYSNVSISMKLYIDADGLPTTMGHSAYILQTAGWDLVLSNPSGSQNRLQFTTRIGTAAYVRSQDFSAGGYTNTWLDVSCSFINGVVSITVNGTTVTSNTTASVITGSDAYLYVGERNNTSSTVPFSGKIDDLKITTILPPGKISLMIISKMHLFAWLFN